MQDCILLPSRCSPNVTCFGAHQCAEKAMKAILYQLNGQTHDTHKLVELASKIVRISQGEIGEVITGIVSVAKELSALGSTM